MLTQYIADKRTAYPRARFSATLASRLRPNLPPWADASSHCSFTGPRAPKIEALAVWAPWDRGTVGPVGSERVSA